jgi:hypothetical protein
MLDMATAEKNLDERPRICVALDEAIEESGLTNAAVALAVNTSEQNVGRWRRNKQPSRETVYDIEILALNKTPGYVSRLAGYVAELSPNELLDVIENTSLLSDGYRRILRRSVEEAIVASAEERDEQASWRKTASTIRRSRKR